MVQMEGTTRQKLHWLSLLRHR